VNASDFGSGIGKIKNVAGRSRSTPGARHSRRPATQTNLAHK
jgi:hypothetical protein